MQSAKELDSHKFPPNIVDVPAFNNFKKLQEEVKNEVKVYNDIEKEMFDNMIAAMNPQQPEKSANEKKIEKLLNDRQIFQVICRVVCDVAGVLMEKIKEKRRYRETLIPRFLIIFFTRWATNLTLDEIGRAVVNGTKLDHCTVSNACAQIKNVIVTKKEKVYPLLRHIILQLREEGIEINLSYDQPKWYHRLTEKDENHIRKILVTG